VERYRALALAVSEAGSLLVDVLAYGRRLNTTADEASGSVAGAERALERMQELVDHAQLIIDDDGRRLLREALDEQREAGQQSEQLTDMAHEARRTAEQYVNRRLTVAWAWPGLQSGVDNGRSQVEDGCVLGRDLLTSIQMVYGERKFLAVLACQ